MCEKPTLAKIKIIATKFEALHGIPYIFGAIDGSHIPIITPQMTLHFTIINRKPALLQLRFQLVFNFNYAQVENYTYSCNLFLQLLTNNVNKYKLKVYTMC
jgi:hypothetical protein